MAGRKISMSRITKPPEERREEIIATARRLFCDKGFDKTTISDIVQEMNVAQGLVYHYFKSKTEILYAVIQQIGDEFVKHMGQEAAQISGGSNALAELQTLLIKRIADMETFWDYMKLEQSLGSEKSLIEYTRSQVILSVAPIIENFIQRGITDESISCSAPNKYAIFLLNGLSDLSFHLQEGDECLVEEIIERMLSAGISKGVRAQ